MSDVVRVEAEHRVATVSLNRPDKLNAMSTEVFEALADAGRRIEQDDDIRAVLVRGEGRAFSSGLDTSSFGSLGDREGPATFDARIPRIQESVNVWARMRKPVVAAVQGYAFGAGLQLAVACDLRLATPDSTWSVFEITYGLVPDLGGTQRLPRLVGAGLAKELIWTARRFSGEEAERWGIVNRVVDAAALDKEAAELTRELASKPPLAVAYAKELVDLAGTVPAAEGMKREAHAQLVCIHSEDFGEAVSAAMEKREGEYKGR